MSVDVVPKYRPAGPLPQCNPYLTCRVQIGERWFQVWCYLYRGAITSDMSADPVPLSHMPACTVQLYQTSIVFIHSFRYLYFSASPSEKASGLLQIHQACIQVRYRSIWFVNLSATIIDAILNISNSEWCMNSNHLDVTRMASVIQESVNLEFCMQIPGVYWS